MINKDLFIIGCCEKYPEELLKDRIIIEGNVIACIYKDLLLLDEVKIDTRDFLTKDGAFYFALASNIRKLGYSSLDEITILSNITELIEEGFNERGGWDSVEHMIEIVNHNNWDTYYDILCRENTLIHLHNEGFNLFKPTCDEKGHEIIPINLFRKMDNESVLDWYEAKLSEMGTVSSTNILEEDETMEITEDFINSLLEGEDGFVPFDILGEDINNEKMYGLPSISGHMMGYLHGTLNFIAGHSSTGKSTILTTIALALKHRGEKILLITNEQKIKAFRVQFLLLILAKYFKYYKITKKKLMGGKDNLSIEDKEMLEKARRYWNENYKGDIACISIADSDVKLSQKKIREYALKKGFTCFIYDTFKLELSDDSTDNHWISLIKDSRAFDKIAKKYNMIGICSMQLALNTLNRLFLDASCLSNSKAVKEILESLLMIRSVYPEELDKDNKKYCLKVFKRKLINAKWIEEPIELDPSSVYKLLFYDKTRNAENSTDTGIAQVLKFNGALGIFTEVGQTRVKHGTL